MSFYKLFFGVLSNLVIFGGLLFVPAGTLNWWRAWVFVGAVFVCTVATLFSLYSNQGLLEERFKSPIQKEQPLADKIILLLILAAFCGVMIFIPLDVFRLHLFSKPESFISALGLPTFMAGWWIMGLAMRENAFAAPVVKHQEARHQTVIDTGLYGVVRHPMYASIVPLLVGASLWLESYAAALLTIVPLGLFAVRILFEERFLKQKLTGYEAYTHRVHYRLIPFLW